MWPNDTSDSKISSSFTKAGGEDSWSSMTYFIQFEYLVLTAPGWTQWTCFCLSPRSVQCPSVWDEGEETDTRERKKAKQTTLRKKTFQGSRSFIWRTRAEEEDRNQPKALQIQEFWSAHQVKEHWICVLSHPPPKRLKSQSSGSLVPLNLPDLWGPGKALGKGYPVSRQRCLRGWRWHQRVLFQ